MKVWDSMFKRPDVFQNLLKAQTKKTVEGVNVLNEFMGIGEDAVNNDILRHNFEDVYKKYRIRRRTIFEGIFLMSSIKV